MVGFTFYSENRTHLYIIAGFRERHRSLRINTSFHSCPRHHFLCKPSSLWFRNFSDVYHHIMCLGIPCFIICIFTTQSFPQGSMYVWLYMAQWLHGALSINTVIMRNEGILDHYEFISSVMVNFSALRVPMTPCLFPALPIVLCILFTTNI